MGDSISCNCKQIAYHLQKGNNTILSRQIGVDDPGGIGYSSQVFPVYRCPLSERHFSVRSINPPRRFSHGSKDRY